jgi:hypothetical protein
MADVLTVADPVKTTIIVIKEAGLIAEFLKAEKITLRIRANTPKSHQTHPKLRLLKSLNRNWKRRFLKTLLHMSIN